MQHQCRRAATRSDRQPQAKARLLSEGSGVLTRQKLPLCRLTSAEEEEEEEELFFAQTQDAAPEAQKTLPGHSSAPTPTPAAAAAAAPLLLLLVAAVQRLE